MKSDKRRQEILSLLGNTENAIPANVLSEKFGVSRQVIVQDVAILRANGYDITSTNRGYLLNSGIGASRVFKCRHSFEEIVDEGMLVINLGGKIEDILEYQLPDSDISRSLLLIKKEKNTPKKYPRKAGTPTKEPLGGKN